MWDLQNLYYESSPCSLTEPVVEWEKRPADRDSIEAVEDMVRDLFLLDEARAGELKNEFDAKMNRCGPLRGCSSCGMREARDDDLTRVRVDELPPVFKLDSGSAAAKVRAALQESSSCCPTQTSRRSRTSPPS